jgi:fructosamine-3-kinase
MICEAVFNGQIDQSYLTQEEIDEFFEIVCEAATDKLMAEAELRGCSVFDSIDGDPIH